MTDIRTRPAVPPLLNILAGKFWRSRQSRKAVLALHKPSRPGSVRGGVCSLCQDPKTLIREEKIRFLAHYVPWSHRQGAALHRTKKLSGAHPTNIRAAEW